jgi:exonuclease SbcC
LVRLLALQASNFKKLRLDHAIQFNDGITLITGLNESGKSSILDAILYALFGRVIRPPRAKNEDLVAYGAIEATVRLDFHIGERILKVSRTMSKTKPTRANLEELRTNSPTRNLATGTEKVNEEIERLLGGITYQEIVSSTVVAQKELNKLIELNKDDRRKVINAFLNLDSFNIVATELGEERRDLEGSGSRKGRLQAEREKLELLKREREEFQRSSNEKQELADENLKLYASAKDLEAKFNEKDHLYSDLRKFETATKTREGLVAQVAGKKRILDDHRTRRERLNKEIEETKEHLENYSAHDQARPVLREIESQLEMARSLSRDLSSAERTWKGLDQEVRVLDGKVTPEERAKLEDSVTQVGKPFLPYAFLTTLLVVVASLAFALRFFLAGTAILLASLIPGVIAGARFKAAESVAKRQLMLGDLRYFKAKSEEVANATKNLTQTKEQLDYIKQGLMKLYKSLPYHGEPSSSPSEITAIETAQAVLDRARKEEEDKKAFTIKLQTLNAEASNLPEESELSGLEKEINNLQLQIDRIELPNLPAGITFGPNALSETLSARDELARQLATAHSRIEQNTKRLRELDRYISEHANISPRVQSQEQVVDQLDHRLRVIKRAVEGVQVTGESLRNRVRPNVQGYMNVVLPALTSSKYRAAMLDEDYNLKVWDPEAGEYRPKEVYSGGTEDQFLLGMRISFALALLPEVKGQKPEFIFLDEPLASSDEVRRSGILRYLADDLSKKFKQIFIISHVGGLEDNAQNIIALEDGRVA